MFPPAGPFQHASNISIAFDRFRRPALAGRHLSASGESDDDFLSDDDAQSKATSSSGQSKCPSHMREFELAERTKCGRKPKREAPHLKSTATSIHSKSTQHAQGCVEAGDTRRGPRLLQHSAVGRPQGDVSGHSDHGSRSSSINSTREHHLGFQSLEAALLLKREESGSFLGSSSSSSHRGSRIMGTMPECPQATMRNTSNFGSLSSSSGPLKSTPMFGALAETSSAIMETPAVFVAPSQQIGKAWATQQETKNKELAWATPDVGKQTPAGLLASALGDKNHWALARPEFNTHKAALAGTKSKAHLDGTCTPCVFYVSKNCFFGKACGACHSKDHIRK